MKKRKIIALTLGVSMLTTTVITSSISLTSCKNLEEVKEWKKLYDFSDSKLTHIKGLKEEAKQLNKLVIPKTVKSFDSDVFKNLSSTKIKELDFRQCTNLTNLPEKAFDKSKNITTLLLPPNLSKINKDQISSLTNIQRINWPANISLKEMVEATYNLPIFIPDCDEAILNQDFAPNSARCTYNNKTVNPTEKNARVFLVPKQISRFVGERQTFGSTIKNVYFQDESLFNNIHDNCLKDNYDLERIVFPSSLKSIGNANFWNMGALIEVASEDNFKNLEDITSWTFVNAPKLKYLDFSGNNKIKQMFNTSFHKLDGLEYILLPNSFRNFNPANSGDNMFFNGAWDSLKYMPMPRDFDFKATNINNQSNRCSGKLRFRVPDKNNKFFYNDLYDDPNVVGIWIDGISTRVEKPYMKKLPNVNFICYRDKIEYFPKK